MSGNAGGRGRGTLSHCRILSPEFVWSDWCKTRKTLLRIAETGTVFGQGALGSVALTKSKQTISNRVRLTCCEGSPICFQYNSVYLCHAEWFESSPVQFSPVRWNQVKLRACLCSILASRIPSNFTTLHSVCCARSLRRAIALTVHSIIEFEAM
jgi:hypothetical protein